MAIELADTQIKVLKDINDHLWNPITCTAEEFGAMRTLHDMGLIQEGFQARIGKTMELTASGTEQVEEYLV